MSVNLNEFSVEEINELITVIEEKQGDLNHKNYELNHRLHEDSLIRQTLHAEYSRKYDILILWETQLRNALVEIVKRETIQSN
jgi:hypothetical protein